MAQLNRTDYKTKIDQKITANGAEAITGTIDNDLRKDQADSFLNLLSDADLLNLRDYSVSKTYTVGEGCFYDDGGGYSVYRCINNTGGSFTGGDWEEISGGGGTTSPLTTKGDLYTYDTGNQRLPVGTDGQVLKADSAETTGLKWDDIDEFYNYTEFAYVDDSATVSTGEIGNINKPFQNISEAATALPSGSLIVMMSDSTSSSNSMSSKTNITIDLNGFSVTIFLLSSCANTVIKNGVINNVTLTGGNSFVTTLKNCVVNNASLSTNGGLFKIVDCECNISNTALITCLSIRNSKILSGKLESTGTTGLEEVTGNFFKGTKLTTGASYGGQVTNNTFINDGTYTNYIDWSKKAGTQFGGRFILSKNTFVKEQSSTTTPTTVLNESGGFSNSNVCHAFDNIYDATNFEVSTVNNLAKDQGNTQIV